eukprot:4420686-Pyramimonas_sp.AAC.1
MLLARVQGRRRARITKFMETSSESSVFKKNHPEPVHTGQTLRLVPPTLNDDDDDADVGRSPQGCFL